MRALTHPFAIATAIGVLVTTLVVAVLPGRTLAGDVPGEAAGPVRGGAPAVDDRRFVRDSVEANQLQVVLFRLASNHAASDATRRLARELLDEHERADDALQELAARKGISLSDAPSGEPAANDEQPRTAVEPGAPASPEDLKPSHARTFDALAALTGPELDAELARTLVSELERTRMRYERAAKDGRDPDVKGYAASTLPAVEDQLRRARELCHVVGADGSSAVAPATNGTSSASSPVAPPYARPVPAPGGTAEPQPATQR